MATNGASEKASSTPSLVDASGYKFPPEDLKPGKLKVSKLKSEIQKANDAREADSGNSSPILPEMDEKTMAAFPTGKPRETQLEKVNCKHCKKTILKHTVAEHIPWCLKVKQEKARKKKEARDAANRAKEKGNDKDKDKDGNEDGDRGISMKGQKSAKKSAGEDGPKKGKKRKADGDEDNKEPKKKKKKDEPKAKAPKPKGPVDVEKQCGVVLANGAQCARSLTCKTHSMGAKRAVPGRSLPYDMLLQAYQKKNQARQQKAAIDANAPVQDEGDGNGPVDSDEEKDAVMAGLSRSRPQPLVTHPLIPTKRKYHLVRMKDMLFQVLGGARGGLFSSDNSGNPGGQGDNLFQSDSNPFTPSATASAEDAPAEETEPDRKSSVAQQATQNRPNQGATAKKTPVTSSGS